MKKYTVNIREKTVSVDTQIPNGWNLPELGIFEWSDNDNLKEQLMGEDLPGRKTRLPFFEKGDIIILK